MICDAHCHMDLMDDMPRFIREMQNSHISIFAVGTTPKTYSREVQFCRDSTNIYVGLGMHPQLISSGYDDMLLFKSLIRKSHFIGEIGLDFSKEYVHTKDLQIEIFREILKLCELCGEKVISIHSLKSVNTVLEILQKYKKRDDNIYVLHWFTGSTSQLKKAIELGCYFSINPNMLKTKSGIEIIRRVPMNRMLIETDAPFVLKVQQVKEVKKVIEETISEISDIVGVDGSRTIFENATKIFRY